MKQAFIILFVFIHVLAFSQNMVPNGGFEDTISCPTNTAQINSARHWFSPRGGGGSSELFHTCHNNNQPINYAVGVPFNGFGHSYTKNGNAYAGCVFFDNPNNQNREYIEVQLLNGLNPTITYYIEFWVSLSDIAKYGIENIGAYFSYNKLELNTQFTIDSIIKLQAQVEHQGGPITDTMNWTKISGYYTPPKDGISYMTIGNFNTNLSTNYQLISYGQIQAYYYIDDILVIDSTQVGIEEYELQKEELIIYPNPAHSYFKIDILTKPIGEISVKIYDISGKLIQSDSHSTERIIVDSKLLNNGLYMIYVKDEQKTLGIKKLIVNRK